MSRLCQGCTAPPPSLPGPEVAIAIVTDRCNLRCPTCSYWRNPADPEPMLSVDEHRALAEELASTGLQRVVLTGGEPMTRRDWPALVETWAARVPELLLLTNGTLVDDDAVRLFGSLSGLRVVLSWDGWDIDALPSSVGRRGMQRVIWDGIGSLCDCRALDGRVGVNITITPLNMERLPRIADELAVRGVDFFHLHLVYAPEPAYRFSYEQCLLLPELVGEAVGGLAQRGIEQIIDHVPYAFVQSSRCYIPFSHSTVGPRGEIFGCIPAKGGFMDVAAHALGRLREQPFGELWASPAYARFRDDALAGRHRGCIACLACHAARNFASEPCRGCADRPLFARRTPEYY